MKQVTNKVYIYNMEENIDDTNAKDFNVNQINIIIFKKFRNKIIKIKIKRVTIKFIL